MRRLSRSILAAGAAAGVALGMLVVGAGSASAYGGDGSMDVYQIGISFNCDNPSFCGSENLGGFWGWGELDHNPTTGANTGDAQLTGCSHGGGFNGASHTSEDITDWHIAPGSAGPQTFFVSGVDTDTFRGQRQVVPFSDNDIGVPALPGHYSSTQIFGFSTPPGVSAQIQVAFKPAH